LGPALFVLVVVPVLDIEDDDECEHGGGEVTMPDQSSPVTMKEWMTRFMQAAGRHRWFIVIAAVALVVRLILVFSADWYAQADTCDYHELASNLMEGRGYVNSWSLDPVWQGYVRRAYRPPGYPLLLVAIYEIAGGIKPHAAMLVNAVCEMATLLLLYGLARFYMGNGFALIPAAAYALCVQWVPNLMTESSFTFCFFLAICLLLQKNWTTRVAVAGLLGLATAFAIMLRPIGVVLFIPVALEWAKRRRLRVLRQAILVALPTLIYLTVWVGRNYVLYGAVFLTSNANQHVAPSYGIYPAQVMEDYRARTGRIQNEVEFERHLKDLIAGAKEKTPGLAARVYFRNLAGLFNLRPTWEVSRYLWDFSFRKHPWIKAWYRRLYAVHYLLYPLGLLGFIASCLAGRCVVIIEVLIGFLLVHPLVSPGNVRFMAPMVPVWCLFTGVAVFLVWARVRNSQAQLAADPQPVLQNEG
jgi:hypothetical protein